MTRVVFAVALAAASFSWTGNARAAEALLISHDVVEVPVGGQAKLRPGFFIGVAQNLDNQVAVASMDRTHREVMIAGLTPGRTIVTAWNLREPNKRVELEIVVSETGVEQAAAAETFYAATVAPAASDPVQQMSTDPAATDDAASNDDAEPAASDETADPN